MTTRSDKFCQFSYWQLMVPSAIYPSDSADGTVSSFDLEDAEVIYRPTSLVPTYAVARAKGTERRVESELVMKVAYQAAWGSLHEIVAVRGPLLGVVLSLSPAIKAARTRPDHVHLINAAEPCTKPYDLLYNKNSFKLYHVNQDILFVTKRRHFRDRANPKFLSFAKEEQ
jgi:hypothetical protein